MTIHYAGIWHHKSSISCAALPPVTTMWLLDRNKQVVSSRDEDIVFFTIDFLSLSLSLPAHLTGWTLEVYHETKGKESAK